MPGMVTHIKAPEQQVKSEYSYESFYWQAVQGVWQDVF